MDRLPKSGELICTGKWLSHLWNKTWTLLVITELSAQFIHKGTMTEHPNYSDLCN